MIHTCNQCTSCHSSGQRSHHIVRASNIQPRSSLISIPLPPLIINSRPAIPLQSQHGSAMLLPVSCHTLPHRMTDSRSKLLAMSVRCLQEPPSQDEEPPSSRQKSKCRTSAKACLNKIGGKQLVINNTASRQLHDRHCAAPLARQMSNILHINLSGFSSRACSSANSRNNCKRLFVVATCCCPPLESLPVNFQHGHFTCHCAQPMTDYW
jgi:hypothetical protein